MNFDLRRGCENNSINCSHQELISFGLKKHMHAPSQRTQIFFGAAGKFVSNYVALLKSKALVRSKLCTAYRFYIFCSTRSFDKPKGRNTFSSSGYATKSRIVSTVLVLLMNLNHPKHSVTATPCLVGFGIHNQKKHCCLSCFSCICGQSKPSKLSKWDSAF